ncbi:MAG: DNA double-strand break repair nuclease NurA [Methanobacteriota archaeon]|nr:MAG: DNA double-strand break repair nuclease NurA [Euryarchaeota archaeon]
MDGGEIDYWLKDLYAIDSGIVGIPTSDGLLLPYRTVVWNINNIRVYKKGKEFLKTSNEVEDAIERTALRLKLEYNACISCEDGSLILLDGSLFPPRYRSSSMDEAMSVREKLITSKKRIIAFSKDSRTNSGELKRVNGGWLSEGVEDCEGIITAYGRIIEWEQPFRMDLLNIELEEAWNIVRRFSYGRERTFLFPILLADYYARLRPYEVSLLKAENSYRKQRRDFAPK